MSEAIAVTHPHFNDRGAVQWQTKFAEALAAARREGKYIFIEFGRMM